jgi:serralysin
MSESAGSDAVPGNQNFDWTISPGTSQDGYVHFNGDHDWWQINLVAGQHYDFALNGTPGSSSIPLDTSLDDPFLSLHSNDPGNTVLASDDDSGPGVNALIDNFTAPYTGSYWLDVGAFADASDGHYTLLAIA